jgi:hypothetical protein
MKKPALPKVKNKIKDKVSRKQKRDLEPTIALATKAPDADLPSTKVRRIKVPTTKYSQREIAGKAAHHFLSVALPIAVYLLVAVFKLHYIAFGLILLSKWQIFVVKPRFWWANLKFSAIDLIYKLSTLLLLILCQFKIDELVNKNSLVLHLFQACLVISYLFWNLYLRKRTSSIGMLLQALTAQLSGLIAVCWLSGFVISTIPIPMLIVGIWIISYSTAQHALFAYEESAIAQLAGFWALFAATLGFMQLIWAQNFILFSSLVYLPLMPFVITGFAYLAAMTHSFVEDEQAETEVPKTQLNKKKQLIIRQSGIACLITIFLALLIAVR